MSEMIDRICENKTCGKHFKAKAADVRRGWGRFHSKRCKAERQAFTHGFNSKESFEAKFGARDRNYTFDGSWDAHELPPGSVVNNRVLS